MLDETYKLERRYLGVFGAALPFVEHYRAQRSQEIGENMCAGPLFVFDPMRLSLFLAWLASHWAPMSFP